MESQSLAAPPGPLSIGLQQPPLHLLSVDDPAPPETLVLLLDAGRAPRAAPAPELTAARGDDDSTAVAQYFRHAYLAALMGQAYEACLTLCRRVAEGSAWGITSPDCMRCRGAFPLQHASLTLLPRHGGGYSACLAQGADPDTLTLPNDPTPGRDITAELLAMARRVRGVPVSLDGEGTPPWRVPGFWKLAGAHNNCCWMFLKVLLSCAPFTLQTFCPIMKRA